MNGALSEAKKRIVCATSSGRPMRFRGTPAIQSRLLLGTDSKAIQHSGVNRTGCHRIHTNIGGSCFKGRCLRQPFYRMFGRSVNGRPWRCPLTQRRRDIDDTARPLRDHDFEFMLKPQKGTEDVGIESRRVTFHGLINERPRFSFGSRIIDRDINASETFEWSDQPDCAHLPRCAHRHGHIQLPRLTLGVP